MIEAVCAECGETFLPDSASDLVHVEREETGTPCGGVGRVLGEWGALWESGPICLDELVTVFGQYPVNFRWNGWLTPRMDALAVEVVFAALYEMGDTDPFTATHEWAEDGSLIVTEYDGDTPYPEVLQPDEDGLYALGSHAWTWQEDTDPEASYRDLVARIGGGFHPDTRGDAYTSLPDGITPERVDAVVDAALAMGLDVYGIALDTVHADHGFEHPDESVPEACRCGAMFVEGFHLEAVKRAHLDAFTGGADA